MKSMGKIACGLLLIVVGAAGCNLLAIQGSGHRATEIREVEPFSGISFRGIGEVKITRGNTQRVAVTVDDNLLELIETRVDDGVLSIGHQANFNSSIGLLIEVTLPEISSLSVSGVGSVTLVDVDTDELEIQMSGVGAVKGDGQVRDLTVRVSGTGSADLAELLAENVTVRVSGVGSAAVHASQSVQARASGVGSVKVHGNPTDVTQTASGIGGVKLVD